MEITQKFRLEALALHIGKEFKEIGLSKKEAIKFLEELISFEKKLNSTGRVKNDTTKN